MKVYSDNAPKFFLPYFIRVKKILKNSTFFIDFAKYVEKTRLAWLGCLEGNSL